MNVAAPSFEDEIVGARLRLRRYAVSLCRNSDTADDLVQDTVVKALSKRNSFQVGSNLDAWLFTILRNQFLSGRRKRRREVEDPDEMMAKKIPLEDSPLKKIEARETLLLVEKMQPAWRIPLKMVAEGASYEEVADELNEQIGTIKSRISRARSMLGVIE